MSSRVREVDSLLDDLDDVLGTNVNGKPRASPPPSAGPRTKVGDEDIAALLNDVSHVSVSERAVPAPVESTTRSFDSSDDEGNAVQPTPVAKKQSPLPKANVDHSDWDSDDGDEPTLVKKTSTSYTNTSPCSRSPLSPYVSSNNVGAVGTINKRQRCGVLKIGGTDWPTGCSPTSLVDKKCDNIRCTKCDFKVIWFDNYSWDPSVTYIFLRNNVPDFDKLKEMLVKDNGYCAYACQCCSRTAKSLDSLDPLGDIRWACGGHA
mmetsp:Transcript_65608/g.116788  ORF Transcript_65608/g.116788 Transcript_65608/m.116788 type:complete len:262 (-) Transcript_65608:1016-1801(-)